jgi:hypothetical protein
MWNARLRTKRGTPAFARKPTITEAVILEGASAWQAESSE